MAEVRIWPTLTTPDAVSMDPEKLERVEEVFRRQIAEGVHPGAGLAVYRYGKPVLDIQGGLADADAGRAVDGRDHVRADVVDQAPGGGLHVPAEAAGPVGLGGCGLQALAGVRQERQGRGDRIYHVMTHQGGFPITPKDLPWTDWSDWDKVVRAMEDATPTFTPGEVFAYHPVNYGWVIAELVRRIDGREFSRFLSEEITGPLGMKDTYVGLPAELEDRVAKIELDGGGRGPQRRGLEVQPARDAPVGGPRGLRDSVGGRPGEVLRDAGAGRRVGRGAGPGRRHD